MTVVGVEIAGLADAEDGRAEVAAPDGCQASQASYEHMIQRGTLCCVIIARCGPLAHS